MAACKIVEFKLENLNQHTRGRPLPLLSRERVSLWVEILSAYYLKQTRTGFLLQDREILDPRCDGISVKYLPHAPLKPSRPMVEQYHRYLCGHYSPDRPRNTPAVANAAARTTWSPKVQGRTEAPEPLTLRREDRRTQMTTGTNARPRRTYMALAKHFEEIIERRGRNAAAIVFEYQYPHRERYRGSGAINPCTAAFVTVIFRQSHPE